MIKELIRKNFAPIHLLAGDKLQLTWKWDNPSMGEELLAEVDADKDMVIDTAIVYRFEDMYGLKEGYIFVAGN